MANGSIVQDVRNSPGSAANQTTRRKRESKNEHAFSKEVEYLKLLGERVRRARARTELTRKKLAAKSNVSERYLAQLEAGKGNVSILLLRQIARALEMPLEALIHEGAEQNEELLRATEILRRLTPEQLQRARQGLLEKYGTDEREARRSRIALIGLRGAGKSSLGALLAERLDLPFLELDRLVEQESGMTLSAIFDLYGPGGFHRYERQCLDHVIARYSRFVLAAGGSLVTEHATFETLLNACYTVWLKAKPEDHMNRVIAQGDRRPMAASPQAMADLRRILASREPLYARADMTLETSGKTVQQSLQELLKAAGAAKNSGKNAAV